MTKMEQLFKRYDLQLVADNEKLYKTEQLKDIVVNSSEVVKKINEIFGLDRKAEEYCILLCLDTRNYLNGAFYIAQGNINSAYINISNILKRALICNSEKIIIAHNHPSGNSNPSSMDYLLTEKLEEASNLIGIKLLDHIVIARDNYTSIMKERMDLKNE